VHLKSLTLRGFKSFASTTILRFEPGVTAVVGPNGSGKSNVVDAIAWVLGEQGAKSLRGGKMEDVIFAGTPGRPPLGRAEVVLTIDNTDGALPIDYGEVTISRLMYRSGSSEYAINGSPCRLLDVQELLSDSGIGRELHVIVGQGQLDAVLHARPEDRRAFLEEAAGVLKHRRRKEKALRKLDAMQANLTRLTDLTAELRRQLGPLGRQAEVARRAAGIQADLRDARLRLLADELAALRGTLEADVADESAARRQRAEVEAALAAVVAEEAGLEQATAAAAPQLAAAAATWYQLAALAESVRGTSRLAAERARHLSAESDVPRPGRDPDQLEAEAASIAESERELVAGLARARARRDEAVAAGSGIEERLAVEERRLIRAVRAVANRREGLAHLAGAVAAARSGHASAVAEAGRLAAAVTEARDRRTRAEGDFAALETEVAGLDEGEVGLDGEYEDHVRALAAAQETLATLVEDERGVERERAALAARRDALRLGLDSADGAAALLDAGPDGVLGRVSALVTVESGAATAVAAALGAAADGVAVADLDAAVASLELLRADGGGRVGLLVGGTYGETYGGRSAGRSEAALPAGARWAVDLVRADPPLHAALDRLLGRTAVVADGAAARALLAAAPDLRVVTRAGDVLTTASAAGGSAAALSRLETQQAVDEVDETIGGLEHRADRLRFALVSATQRRALAAAAVEETLSRLHDSDARLAAVAERLGNLGAAARAAAAEADRLEAARQRAATAADRDGAALAELAARLSAAEREPAAGECAEGVPAEGAPTAGEPDPAERDRLVASAAVARQVELEARLAVRTAEERVRALAGRAEALLAAAAAERAAARRAVLSRERRARQATRAAAVSAAADVLIGRVESALGAAAERRDAAEAARSGRERALVAVRTRSRELAADVDALTGAVHRDEVARAELRLRIEAVESRALTDYAVPADALVSDYGPDVPVPAPEEGGEAATYDREAQQARAGKAERALARLGRVNPLALEEYAALEERHAFLVTQLDDLRATRRDLLTVVREVDERVEEVFAAAFADTAREFETVFATLFPGGSGRLLLTDPSDLLTSGIEVEARPAGKRVSRLSLLSGGERSLTAIAMLVAIFRARPSPFYVLDEVEAALDDRNLGRLVGLFADLRTVSQLIVITHQKRTMEVADALYGVTMRDDGVTAVISQRLREPAPA